MLGDEPAQRGQTSSCSTELQAGIDLVLARRGAQLVEPGDLGPGEPLVGHVLEWLTAPQAERLLQLTDGPRCRVRIPGGQPPRAAVTNRSKRWDVDRVRLDVELVAAGGGS